MPGQYLLNKVEAWCPGPLERYWGVLEGDRDPDLTHSCLLLQPRVLALGAHSYVGHWRRLWFCSSGTSQ